MNQKVLKTLEYDRIIEMLTADADSAPGKKKCAELVPSIKMDEIQRTQK